MKQKACKVLLPIITVCYDMILEDFGVHHGWDFSGYHQISGLRFLSQSNKHGFEVHFECYFSPLRIQTALSYPWYMYFMLSHSDGVVLRDVGGVADFVRAHLQIILLWVMVLSIRIRYLSVLELLLH